MTGFPYQSLADPAPAFNTGGALGDINRDGQVTSSEFFAWVTAFLEGCD